MISADHQPLQLVAEPLAERLIGEAVRVRAREPAVVGQRAGR